MSNGQGTRRNRRRKHHASRTALCLALLVVLSGNSAAIDVDYEIGVAAKHSDNIALSETNAIDDTVISPRLYFQVGQAGRNLELFARGDFEYLDYTNGTFDDEVRGRFAGKANWMLLPDRIDFVVQDSLSLQPVDQFAAFAPSNQQQVNVFVTGPTLYARFNGRTRGQLDLRYINSYAEKDDGFNSDRYNAAARLSHDLTASQKVSANLEATDVRFDLVGRASDYRRYDGYVNWTANRHYVDLSLDLGSSRLELDDRESRSYPLGRATLDWRLSPRSALRTTLRYQLNDAAQALISPADLDFDFETDRGNFNDFRIPDAIVEPNIFRERLARVRYSYNGARLDVRVAPYYRRIRYVEELAPSQDRRGASVNIDYRLRPRLTLAFQLAREHRDYIGIAREDKDLVASIGLANRFNRHWTGRADFQRRERDSTEPGRSYDENAVMVSLSYRY